MTSLPRMTLGVQCYMTLLLLALVSTVTADWLLQCPDSCKCTYISNRKVATCERTGYHTIPSMLSPEVQELNLNDNSVTYLEKKVFKRVGLINLKLLKLSNNKITGIDKDAFEELSVVFQINLENNLISKLHPKTFKGLHRLITLDLSGNRLTRLSADQFPPLPFLRNLYINDCLLDYINSYAFENLPQLNHIRLSGNKLRILEPQVFSNQSELKSIDLHNNDWVCDCKLKKFVQWIKNNNKVQSQLTCASPARLTGHKWESLDDDEIACLPQLQVNTDTVPVALGHNVTLMCSATGDPLPSVYWVYNRQGLTNATPIWYSSPERMYLIFNGKERDRVWSNLVIRNLSRDDISTYTCVADNVAGLVDKNISLVLHQSYQGGDLSDNKMTYIIIAVIICSILFILISVIICYFCWRRKRQRQTNSKDKIKQNGSLGHHMEHQNILIVNPVEKPPRQYEKVPQTDVELNTLAEASNRPVYDYQEYASHYQQPHSPLATLEEECDDTITHDTTLEVSLPLHSSIDQSSHFPDLLDNARLPRAVSPTQLSYHSLIYPTYPTNNADWRYSYILPGEHTRYPAGYSTPQPTFRPGYVTLPRRPRAPSWAGSPAVRIDEDGEPIVIKPIPAYDKLGPRTTVDGTSRTDLTKPSRSSIVSDPYSLVTPTTPTSPSNQGVLPPHYTPISDYKSKPLLHSATLPRSTPNLLDDKSFSASHNPPSTVTAVVHKPSLSNVIVPPSAGSPTPSNASTLRLASPGQPSPSPGCATDNYPGPSVSPHNYLKDSSLPSSHNNNSLINNKNMETTSSIVSADPNNISVVTSIKKKVPPKPPPKPSMAKRLSVTSPGGDGPKLSTGDGARIYQDEGPDGTEV